MTEPRSSDLDNPGLHSKYTVTRSDGRSAPGQKHERCQYFVLDLNHDPFAIAALQAYMEACKPTMPELAADIKHLVNEVIPVELQPGTPPYPEVHRLLALSTVHVSESSREWLTEQANLDGGFSLVVYEKSIYGWFIPIIDKSELIDTGFRVEGIPQDVQDVLKFAHQNGCTWLMFDRDADQVEGLPVYQ